MVFALENNNNGMLVRLSEIEVHPEYREEYLHFAKDVAIDSVKKEEGVIAIYPMAVIKDHNQIKILEIYKDEASYKSHIPSPHFQQYKQSTLHMVKTLNLTDMYQLNPAVLKKIFIKAKKKAKPVVAVMPAKCLLRSMPAI